MPPNAWRLSVRRLQATADPRSHYPLQSTRREKASDVRCRRGVGTACSCLNCTTAGTAPRQRPARLEPRSSKAIDGFRSAQRSCRSSPESEAKNAPATLRSKTTSTSNTSPCGEQPAGRGKRTAWRPGGWRQRRLPAPTRPRTPTPNAHAASDLTRRQEPIRQPLGERPAVRASSSRVGVTSRRGRQRAEGPTPSHHRAARRDTRRPWSTLGGTAMSGEAQTFQRPPTSTTWRSTHHPRLKENKLILQAGQRCGPNRQDREAVLSG